jgi:hypothetical protein
LNSPRNFLQNRLSLLVALLAVLGVALAGPQQPAAMAMCPDAALVYYYSDATLTTKVGQCVHACCQLWTCTGELTNYSVVVRRTVCDFS